jgi:hemerythrin
MRFMWDPKYSVSIKSIDTQHQTFFEIINQIYFQISQKDFDRKELLKVVKKLIDYGKFHLDYEEEYFKKFRYPDIKAHITIHKEFRSKVDQYQKLIEKPDTDMSKIANEIADFCKEWLSLHILDMDHKYSQFFLLHDVH